MTCGFPWSRGQPSLGELCWTLQNKVWPSNPEWNRMMAGLSQTGVMQQTGGHPMPTFMVPREPSCLLKQSLQFGELHFLGLKAEKQLSKEVGPSCSYWQWTGLGWIQLPTRTPWCLWEHCCLHRILWQIPMLCQLAVVFDEARCSSGGSALSAGQLSNNSVPFCLEMPSNALPRQPLWVEWHWVLQ